MLQPSSSSAGDAGAQDAIGEARLSPYPRFRDPNAVHTDVFESLAGSECETLTSCE